MRESKKRELIKMRKQGHVNRAEFAFFFAVFLQLSGVCGYKSFAQAEEKYAYVEARDFPGGRKESSMYSGISTASDGKVYICLCVHGGPSQFYQYDPAADSIRHIADIPEFLGEKGKGTRTTCKLHTKPVEDSNGRIYFGTMCEDGGPVNIEPSSWQGHHWIRYDPKTDKLEDLGLDSRVWGTYGLVIDRRRNYLFATDWSGHIFRFDIERRVTRDLGRVDNWDVLRSIAIDEEGNVYGCYPPGAKIWKYDAKTERIYDLSVSIPYDAAIFPRMMTNPMLERKAIWRVVEWDPVEKVIYGVTGGDSVLFRYDPKDGPEGKVTVLEKLCCEYFYHTGHKNVPYSTLAFTIGRDRKIYYAPVGVAFDFMQNLGAVDLAENFGAIRMSPGSELITYDLRTGKREYPGILKTKDGRNVFGCGGATCGPDGTIYFCGAVEAKDEKEKAGLAMEKYPFKMSLLIYKPNRDGR
jgi:hypothetical protein